VVQEPVVVMGRIGAPYGVKGWVKLHPSTEELDALLGYESWWLGDGSNWQPISPEAARVQGKHLVVKFEGVETPEAASLWTHKVIGVLRSSLPELDSGEYYWSDLEGLNVVTEAGQSLGQVDRLFETGANDVMVVKGDRERLIPFVLPEVVKNIDLTARQITVDWDPEF